MSPTRLLVALGFFVLLLCALLVPDVIRIWRRMNRGKATGIGFVVGSRAENIFRLVVVIVLTIFAYWLSGKFVEE